MDSEKSLISVIMPAYNVERYIVQAIESILNQTYSNFELLICDDGSTDKTIEIVKTFSDSRIKLFENNINRGNLQTTNFLFSQCKGDYIALQDADDYSVLNRLELQLDAFQNNSKLGIVGSYYQLIDSTNKTFSCGILPKSSDEIRIKMEKEVPPFLYPSIMVKKSIANKVGSFQFFFNRKGYADFDWMARICEISEGINLPISLYFYRRHSDSFTMKAAKKKQSELSQYMHFLLVEAHHVRLKGKKDFFEENNLKGIKKRIGEKQLLDAKMQFWDKNKMNFHLFYRSFINFPFNLKLYKDVLYTHTHTHTHTHIYIQMYMLCEAV